MSHTYLRSGRSLAGLWGLLTVATTGFALLAAGIYLESNRWIGFGTGVFTLGGISFLFVQFWTVSTRSQTVHGPVPAATQVAVSAPFLAPATGAHAEEELVEFQLIGEKEAPTSLEVPPAFQIEARADAAPLEPSTVFPWRAKDAAGGDEKFAHATGRRNEIVQGLPLLSSIFGSGPAPLNEAAPERAGRTRGQCGGCGTMLWAPATRPLRLRCPKCGHVRTLTE